MKNVFYFVLFFVGLTIVSCSKDIEEDLNPDPGSSCDTVDMSFQSDVLTIFDSNCNGCHNASQNFGNVTLDNYDDAKRVVDAGKLLGAIKHEEGFSFMPQGGSQLSDCTIAKIESWVNDGALDN